MTATDTDVTVVGAGISGSRAPALLCPDCSRRILRTTRQDDPSPCSMSLAPYSTSIGE
jgi:hypothetical protein